MSVRKEYLNGKDFEEGLAALDSDMGQNAWLIAFAPIRLITAGGFVAVSYLKNRDSTGDLDYLIDPEFAGDKDIEGSLQTLVLSVAERLSYNNKWVNDDMAIFVTKRTRQALFDQAIQRGITLFKGENLEVLAAPIEWALERKLRRIYAANRDRKTEMDIADAIAFFETHEGAQQRRSSRSRNDSDNEHERVRCDS